MPSLRRKILIVDDSPEDRETWRHHLASDPNCIYECVECPSLEEALAACRAQKPDCILLDYQLNDGNGVDFIEDLRELGGTLCFPTVMLTATGNEQIAVSALKAGAQDYLLKYHVEAGALHRALDAAIHKAETERLMARQRVELEKAYRETEEAYRQAKEANARKDQFLAVLSHELRTPLTPILTAVSDPSMETAGAAELREVFRVIRRNVELEARLIDDLLDHTRIIHGKLELRTQPVDVHELIRHALDICRPAAAGKNVTLTDSLSAARHVVQGDPARLQQVFWNLLNNAVKFTPAGGNVRIETALRPKDGWIEVKVTDTGVGIPAERLDGIFEAFEQGGQQVSRQFGGLGLGLSICKALMEAHGGHVAVESAGLGRGTTFRVAMETTARQAAPSAAPDASPPPADAGPDSAASARQILLVEDHVDSARALIRLLRRRGYEVVHAGTVAEAKALFASHVIDAVISDLGLPDGDGARLIRDLRAARPVPCVVLSGFGEADVLAESMSAGALAHLLKPVAWPQLEEALRKLF